MTTNSPNPVDGDVQALIADCEAEIKHIEHLLSWKKPNEYSDKSLRSKLARQQVALASLTAVPDHYKIDVYKGDRLIASCHPSEPDHSPPEEPYRFVETAYYTAPPAQLLRPVELPVGFNPAIIDSEMLGKQSLVMRRNQKEGNWLHKCVVTELLRSLGYEVKS